MRPSSNMSQRTVDFLLMFSLQKASSWDWGLYSSSVVQRNFFFFDLSLFISISALSKSKGFCLSLFINKNWLGLSYNRASTMCSKSLSSSVSSSAAADSWSFFRSGMSWVGFGCLLKGFLNLFGWSLMSKYLSTELNLWRSLGSCFMVVEDFWRRVIVIFGSLVLLRSRFFSFVMFSFLKKFSIIWVGFGGLNSLG